MEKRTVSYSAIAGVMMLIASMTAFLMASVDNPLMGYRGSIVFPHAVGWINVVACITAVFSSVLFLRRKYVGGIVLGVFVIISGVAFSIVLLYRPYVGSLVPWQNGAYSGLPLIAFSSIALALARFEHSKIKKTRNTGTRRVSQKMSSASVVVADDPTLKDTSCTSTFLNENQACCMFSKEHG